jgi:endonuclease/exonuclease/phosphatase family metal-dependent hydrolase
MPRSRWTRPLIAAALTAAMPALVPAGAVAKPATLRVMTYNLYQGSELTHSINAGSISALPAAVAADWADVQASDIPARMGAIAAEIKVAHPDFVGLEEAALWRTQSPSNLSVRATTVAYDFVDILVKALQANGASYRVAGIVNNFDLQAPGSFPSGSMDIRITDRVAVLVRSGVTVTHTQAKNYKATSSITAAGIKFVISDGFVAVDAKVGARKLRFVATHLDALSESVRTAQAKELVKGPTKGKSPLVLVGDFNSAVTTPAYKALVHSGLKDSWLKAMPGNPGFTCCHNPNDLVSNTPPLSQRIDYVFERGLQPQSLAVIGTGGADRTPSGMRPSDHAGLAATLKLG